jgi:hypothetical protein
VAEPVLSRRNDAWEDTSSEQLKLPGGNSVIMKDHEIQVKSNEKQTIKHLILMWQRLLSALWIKILAQVQPNTQDLKTGITMNTFLPFKKFCNGQPHRKKSLRQTHRGCHL